MKESSGLELVKKLVSEKAAVRAPSVTCGSSEERRWWPPYVVNSDPKK